LVGPSEAGHRHASISFDECGRRTAMVATIGYCTSWRANCSIQGAMCTVAAARYSQRDGVQSASAATTSSPCATTTCSSQVLAALERQAQQHEIRGRQRTADDDRCCGMLPTVRQDGGLYTLVVSDRPERQGEHLPLGYANVLLLDARIGGGRGGGARLDLRLTSSG